MSFAQSDFQPGYIIKSNGDSLSGFIARNSDRMNFLVSFKDTHGKKQKYSPGDIRAYGFVNGKFFLSRDLISAKGQQELLFVEVLVKGTASLYRYRDLYLFEKTNLHALLEKPEVIAGVKSRNYVDVLNEQLEDCGLKADETKYEERNLTNLIQNYNRCKGSIGIVYKEEEKLRLRININAFAGLDQSVANINGFSKNAFKATTSFTGGVAFDFSEHSISNRFSLDLEFWYGKRLYQGYSETNSTGGISRQDILMSESFLKIPFGLRYNFFKEGRTPYLKAGFVKYSLFSPVYELRTETESNGTVLTTVSKPDSGQKGQSGVWFSAGYSQVPIGRFRVFGEFRYELTTSTITLDIPRSATYFNSSLVIGLRF